MTEIDRAGRPLRRILVALDASRASLAALQAAAALAARHGAELEALFVEDVDLLRMAAFPFSGQFTLSGGHPLPSASILAGVQALAERARAALQDVAATRRLRSSFRVTRGRVEAEVLQAAVAADLLVLGRAGRGWGGALRPGTAASAVLAHTAPPVLLTIGEPREALPLVVAWDGSNGAQSALDLALRLSGAGNGSPALLVTAPGRKQAEELAALGAARAGRTLPWRWAGGPNPGDLRRALPRNAVLVLGAASPIAGGPEGLERLLAEALCPVLLAR